MDTVSRDLVVKIRTMVGPERERTFTELLDGAKARLSVSNAGDRGAWFDSVSGVVLGEAVGAPVESEIELCLTCAMYYYSAGMASLGLATAMQAVKYAEQIESWKLLRRSYSMVGTLYGATRNRAQETIWFAKAIELARRIDDHVGVCATLSNIAKAHYNSGLLTRSIELNLDAIQACDSDLGLLPTRIQAHHNTALAALALEDKLLAVEHISRCIELMPLPQTSVDAYLRVIAEFTYTKALVKIQDVPGAYARAKLARKFAEVSGSPPALIQATLAEAWCDIHAGMHDIALTRLAAIEKETRHNDSITRDLLEAQIYAYRLAGRATDERTAKLAFLAHLGTWQSKAAQQQIQVIARVFRNSGAPSETDLSILSPVVRQRLSEMEAGSMEDFVEQLETIAVLAELRDDTGGEHAYRVGKLAGLLAIRLGYPVLDAESIEMSARLHDIGKLMVPDVVLQKMSSLDDVELEVMRRHCLQGASLLRSLGHARFDLAAIIAEAHHEWWDGGGYPLGKSGDAIPVSARLVAIADVYDALTHCRPYKGAWPHDEAIEHIAQLSGRQFEPRACAAFLELVQELRETHGDGLGAFLAEGASRSPFMTAHRVIDREATTVRRGRPG